jgi:hypothetical protein
MKSTQGPNWCNHDYEISGSLSAGHSPAMTLLYTCNKCGYTKRDNSKETK